MYRYDDENSVLIISGEVPYRKRRPDVVQTTEESDEQWGESDAQWSELLRRT